MKRLTQYSADEFLEDYHSFASRSALLIGLTPKDAAGLTKAVFIQRYSDSPDTAEERMNAFLKAMVAIESNYEKLTAVGYLNQVPAGNYSRVSHNLIRALHRLIVEKNKDNPTFDEIKETADFFSSRN
jgi:hypothetical protein